ncbi:unnamed protein product [Auanema sp. JU1783]|nr:unnamed protein product [Auanema sp. JU1783]
MTDEVNRNRKKKSIKVLIRRLPPYMTWNELKVQLDPIPPTEYISFVAADLSFEPNAFCRCYLAFSSDEDVIDFSERFNRYLFVDSKGYESAAIVELSLFGKLPKSSPQDAVKDTYCGQVQDEFEYKQFLDELENSRKCNYLSLEEQIRAVQVKDERSKNRNYQQTPLTKFMFQKNEEKIKKREEKKKSKGEERKMRLKEKNEEEKKKKAQESSYPTWSEGTSSSTSTSRPKERTGFVSRSNRTEFSRSFHVDDSGSTRPTEKVKEKPAPRKKESKPKEKREDINHNFLRNSNRNSHTPKADSESKPEKGYRYTKTFTSSRITALSKDPSEKKKNKARLLILTRNDVV